MSKISKPSQNFNLKRIIYVTRSSCKDIGLPKQKSEQGEEMSTIYRKNEYAEAEPAVQNWKMGVDDLFR
jgi:hypothetical protein